jgi:hypothetical protein
MKRTHVAFSLLGLMLATGTALAQVPKTVKILGQEYDVIAAKRYGLFKNGVTVNLQKGGGDSITDEDVAKKAALSFAPGASPAQDRLFVAAAHQDDPGPTSDGIYMLRGTDANGVFSPEVSEATVFARGNKDVHGRPQNITWIGDHDTGVKKDRNLYMHMFTERNTSRFFDLDSLTMANSQDYRSQAVYILVQPTDTDSNIGSEPEEPFRDPNMPQNPYFPAAMTPNGMMIVAGRTEASDGIEIGVIDPVKGEKFFPVKTNLAEVTADSTVQIDPADAIPQAMVRLTGDEYLMIATLPDGGVNANEGDLDSQILYRMRIELPADLTKEAPNSIKVAVLGKEDLPALSLGQSATHKIYGVAVGRELAPGRPILYMADWAGNLFTLRPKL